MSVEKQLPLPNLKVLSKGPVAVFIGIKDVESNPKILLARRPSGRYTFPGGKSKPHENPINTAIRETHEETGWEIYSSEYLISPTNDFVRIAADGFERNFYLFFGFTDECMDNDIPKHLEPDKNGSWEWIQVKDIPSMVLRGDLHPIVLKADLPQIIAEAREVSDPQYEIRIKNIIESEEYDYPF